MLADAKLALAALPRRERGHVARLARAVRGGAWRASAARRIDARCPCATAALAIDVGPAPTPSSARAS